MMSLEQLHALWAEDDEAKMELARQREAAGGPRGWRVGADGVVSAAVDVGGEMIALPLP